MARASWWLLLGTGGLGAALLPFHTFGVALVATCAGGMLARAVRPTSAAATSGAVTALALLLAPFAPVLKVVVAALAAQLCLAWLARSHPRAPARLVIAGSGHAAALTASAMLLAPGGGSAETAALAYVGGFGVLVLAARWGQRGPVGPDAWDLILVALLALAAIGATFAYVASTALLPSFLAPPTLILVAACGLGMLVALAHPPPAPPMDASALPGAIANGIAILGVLNVLFSVFSLVAAWSARVVIVLLTAYIALAVALEYRAVRRMRASRELFTRPTPPLGDARRVTVLMAARDEAETLARSLEKNLLLPQEVRFLLVPSDRSSDETVRIAQDVAARHPERVRVLLGTAGSKAGDLNLAWSAVETPFVLILDADETIDAGSLAWALAAMDAAPGAGVVQGRKVSQAPSASLLARFVSTERRHATGLDQMLHAELGSTHFAGSAALLRRGVVDEVGGWSERTLTEDIEFTLRLHLETPWRIVYEPRMLVREADPASWDALVKQRTRWARGWTQCFTLYFGEVLRRRRALGRARAAGLVWLLLMAVSAPAMALLPAFLLMRAVGIPSLLPYAVGIVLAAFILPARLVGYGYAALHDPHIPVPRRARALAGTLAFAYAWILVGWILSLHALYLELAAAPRAWDVTRKAHATTLPAPRKVVPG